MTVANPAPLAAFWSRLNIQSAEWSLGSATVSSRTEGGETITAERGARLWRGSVTLAPMAYRDADALRARLQLLSGADRSFLCYPMPNYAPSVDSDGALVAVNTPSIAAIGASRVEMSLAGLPVPYTLQGGDFLSFTYGTNPTRYALHQIIDDEVEIGGGGSTDLFEVRPAIRTGASVGAAVRIYRPMMRAQLIRDSVSYGTAQGLVVSGMGFSVIQTLRG